ncbi:MAG: threonylcarbamoyl-AMP synthase [Chloroflexi bacterium]|nr:threonylcarbamoyl-AMP synthase [Chloroflexota bacterium]
MTIQARPVTAANMAIALALLRQEKVIAIPTDTVYGVAADAYSDVAVARLYTVKRRPRYKAIALLLSGPEQLSAVAKDFPAEAMLLARQFWPGGLTLIVPALPGLSGLVTAGSPGVGCRVPDHPVPRYLARELGHPLAATSANISGQPDPLTATEVIAQLQDQIPLVLDGGALSAGLPSTVVDCLVSPPQVLRAGAISLDLLRQVIPGIELAQ